MFYLIVSLIRSEHENELDGCHVECQIFVHVYAVSFEAENNYNQWTWSTVILTGNYWIERSFKSYTAEDSKTRYLFYFFESWRS